MALEIAWQILATLSSARRFPSLERAVQTRDRFTVLDRSRGEWGEPADDVTAMTINYLLFSISRWGRLRGPFEVLFRTFWDTYLARSKDREVLRTTAPFFAFRGLVIASPLWYPDLPISARRKLFGFIENVLTTEQFNPADVNQYCNC